MRLRYLTRRTALTIVLGLAASVSAAAFVTTTWTGAGGDWNTGGNWNTGNVPTAADDARILNGGTATISVAGAAADSVEISGGSRLRVTGAGELAAGAMNLTGEGSLTVDAGGEVTQSGGAALRTGPTGQAFIDIEGAGSRINWVGGTVVLGSADTSFLSLIDGGEFAAGTITTAPDTSSAIRVGLGGVGGVLSADVDGSGTGSTSLYFNHTNDITFSRNILGPVAVGKFGAGTLTFTNANGNPSSTLIVGGILRAGAVNVLGSETLSVQGSGRLDLNGFDQSVGALEGDGTITLGDATLTTTFDDGARTFSGVITGTALIKSGTGELTLSGANGHTATVVQTGAVFINGNQPLSAVNVNGGWFGGTGQVGQVGATSGIISPGADFGSEGALSASTLSMITNTELVIDISAAVPGTGYDQLTVGSGVSLGNAALGLNVDGPIALGEILTIVQNADVSAVAGTFAGLPEGASIDAGGQTFVISYAGGNGNDITLQAVAPVPSMPWLGMLMLGGLLGGAAYLRLRGPGA